MNKEQIWLDNGYYTFAFEGPKGLKVETLAKSVGKNKSSFYHFFADLEIFVSKLLKLHLERTKEMAKKESQAETKIELAQIILEHKVDLFFNRQLRVHRDNNAFKTCFLKTNEMSVPSLLPVWKKIMGLAENNYLAKMVLMLSIENFFLQITDETLNEAWIIAYFDKINETIRLIKSSNSIPILDGSV